MTSLPATGQTQAQLPNEALGPTGGTSSHKLVLCTNGTVTGWGDNGSGQLGVGSSYIPTPVTVPLTLPANVVKVANTSQSSFAILANGTLWAWGGNADGQLGVGSSTTTTATAMQVPGLAQVIAVSGGFFHTMALCADGTVWSWGKRSDGALGTGLAGAATQYLPQQITALSNIRAIACGDQFSMALDASGHIWSWGSDSNGELGIGQPAYSPPQATPVQVALSNVRQIEAANVRAAALCTDGTVWNWGKNAAGQLGLGNTAYTNTPAQVGAGTITDAVWVAMNTEATIAVRATGSTYVWGFNSYGSLGINSPSFAPLPIAGPVFSPNAQISGQGFLFTSHERTGTVQTWGFAPLGYTPSNPGPGGCSYKPTSPDGVCLAVPAADFPECGPLRAYYMNPTATYVAARHGYTVSPAEVGTFGLLTTIDASQAPYNGTVVFDGIYHLRGDVRFINGSFETRQGTVFYINGRSGRPTDSQQTSIETQDGNLLLTNTELRAQCDELWQGIVLGDGTQIRTQGAGKNQRLHSIIRDAGTGVYNSEYSHYFLSATDFINNGVGVMDAPRTNVLAGEGAQSCRFVTDPAAGGPFISQGNQSGGTGINFYDTSLSNSQNYYGDFGNAAFAYNSFENLMVGVRGTAGNASILNSQFTNCWLAAAYSEGRPNSPEAVRYNMPTLPMVFRNNSFALPANLPASYLANFPYPPAGYTTNTVVYGTTYGVNAQAGYELRNNTFTLAPASPGVASRRVGVVMVYQGTVLNNSFSGLSVGIEARSGEWYMPTSYDLERNTLTDNTEGVSFLPPTYYNGPPTMSVTLRCNTFSGQVSGATGVWVKAGTLFPNALGSSSLPNGNRFDGIDPNKRFVYDAGTGFQYFRYNSPQEALGGTTPSNQGNVILTYGGGASSATVTQTQVSGAGACGTSTTPGVYARSVGPSQEPAAADASPIQLSEAYPNPATETVSFAYTLPATCPSAELVLRDLMGRCVARQTLPDRAGKVSVSVQHLPAGFYTGALEVAGHRQASHKLTVAH